MQQETSPVSQIPVIRISYNANISEKAGLIFETFIGSDEPKGKIDALVDKLVAVTDRQAGKCELERLYVDLEAIDGQVGRLKEDMDRVETAAQEAWDKSGRKGEFKLTANEQQAKRNTKATLEGMVKRRDQVKMKIVELTEKGR